MRGCAAIPNAAVLRVVNMLRDRQDAFVNLAQLMPGDHVLDCTCGMGADAIAAAAVGESGAVRALEASPLLALLAQRGMQRYRHPNHIAVTEAMRRVSVFSGHYQDVLPTCKDNSFDVVYFDPMFDQTVSKSNGLDLVRTFAQSGLHDQADISEAQRVARRCVLMKDQMPGRTLQALGFSLVKKARRFCWPHRMQSVRRSAMDISAAPGRCPALSPVRSTSSPNSALLL